MGRDFLSRRTTTHENIVSLLLPQALPAGVDSTGVFHTYRIKRRGFHRLRICLSLSMFSNIWSMDRLGRIIPWTLQQPAYPVMDTSWNKYCYGYVMPNRTCFDRMLSTWGVGHFVTFCPEVASFKNARLLLTPSAYRSSGHNSPSSSFVELGHLEREKNPHYRHVQSWIFVSGILRADLLQY